MEAQARPERPSERSDGRHQRSARSREAVVDAMLDLMRATGEQPGAQEVADRANVSLRTVFRHFDDVENLLATAVAHQMERVGHRFAPLPPMSVDDFVAHRAALFEEIAPVRRVGMRRVGHDVIRHGLVESHRLLRRQIELLFQPDPITLDALDAACGWPAWDALRSDQGLSVGRARAVMAHTVTRLLEK